MTRQQRIKSILNIFSFIYKAYCNKLPKATIYLERNNKNEVKLVNNFNKINYKFPLAKKKTIGIAIINTSLYDNFDNYINSMKSKNSPRYFNRRAQKKGYTFSRIKAEYYIKDIHRINLSLDKRQGRKMDESYLRTPKIKEGRNNKYFGVFKEDQLVAYILLSEYDEFTQISQLLGHGEYLKDGIMYRLVYKAIEYIFTIENTPKYIMYDSFWGNSDGLALFKRRFRFEPFHINWKLK